MAKRKRTKKKARRDVTWPLFKALHVILFVVVFLVAVMAVLTILGGEKTSHATEYAALVIVVLMLSFLVKWEPCKRD